MSLSEMKAKRAAGRGWGAPEVFPAACSLSSFEKNFCAWLRICTAVFVPMCSAEHGSHL